MLLNPNLGYSLLVLPDENRSILIMQLMTILIFLNHQINGNLELFHKHTAVDLTILRLLGDDEIWMFVSVEINQSLFKVCLIPQNPPIHK